MKTLPHVLTACFTILLGWTACVRAARTSEYLFVVDRSIVVQTGGIAGVQRTFGIEGRFLLKIDDQAGTASFVRVDADLAGHEDPPWPGDLNDIFNLAQLAGTVVDDDLIRFVGHTDDGSAVCIVLRFAADGSVRLTGQTIPPAGSADFFVFTLDAVARPGCPADSGWATGKYAFAADASAVVQTGGFAGTERTYGVQGEFVLKIDPETGAASFVRVDARLLGAEGGVWPQTLEEIFNLTQLVGTVVDDTLIRFVGHTDDGSAVCIAMMRQPDGSVRLTGRTIPPANSADFFVFTLDALARSDCDAGGPTGAYAFLPERSTLIRTGGLAGIRKVYRLEGDLRLLVDSAASTAEFARVDVNVVDPLGEVEDRHVDEVLNLSGLAGTLQEDGSILFQGQVSDASEVRITLLLDGRCAYLLGETVPPPDSADFPIFELDAVAQRECGVPVG